MDKRKLIAIVVLIAGSLLATGCVNGGGKSYKDCGTAADPQDQAIKCFSDAFSNCTPTKVSLKSSEQNSMEYLIEGGKPGQCKVSWKIEKSDKYSEIQGEKITCTIEQNSLKGPVPDFSKAYDKGNCESTATKEFQTLLGGIKTPQSVEDKIRNTLAMASEQPGSKITGPSLVEFQGGVSYSPKAFESVTGGKQVKYSCHKSFTPYSCEVKEGSLYVRKDFKSKISAECNQSSCKVRIKP